MFVDRVVAPEVSLVGNLNHTRKWQYLLDSNLSQRLQSLTAMRMLSSANDEETMQDESSAEVSALPRPVTNRWPEVAG